MLVTCSGCKGRFRIADERVPPEGVRARCSRCSTILFIRQGREAVALPSSPADSGSRQSAGGFPGAAAAAGASEPASPAPPPLPDPEPEVPEPERTRPPDPWGGVYESRSQKEPPPPPPPMEGVDWDAAAAASPGPREARGYGELQGEEGIGGAEFDPADPPAAEGAGGWELGAQAPERGRGAPADPPSRDHPPPPPPPPAPESSRFGEVPASREDPFAALGSDGFSFGAFEPEEVGASSGAGDEEGRQPGAPPPPPPAAPASLAQPGAAALAETRDEAEPKVPFPQLSTVRRPPSKEPPQRPWVRSSLGKISDESRLSVIFWGMVLTVMVTYGALVGLGRDPLGLWEVVGLGEVGEPIQLRSGELSVGFYPLESGGELLYLRGTVHRLQAAAGDGPIRVEATLRDADGAAVARSSGWAGLSPGAEELNAVHTEADWIQLSQRIAERLMEGRSEGQEEQLPFVLAFPEVDPGSRELEIEVVAKALPAVPPPARQQRETPQPEQEGSGEAAAAANEG